MLTVAATRLLENGVTPGFDVVRMEQVIADAGVSRASAYRIWPSKDAFLADVLAATIRRTTLLPETSEDVAHLFSALDRRREALHTAQGRRDAVVELLRIAADADIRRILASPEWRFFYALLATHRTLPAEQSSAVAQALREVEDEFVAERAVIYERLARLIGYRLTAPWTAGTGFRHMSRSAGLTMHGVVMTALPRPGWLDERTPLALFGTTESAPWSDAEVAIVRVVLTHLEPDPSIAWTPARVEAAEAEVREIEAGLRAPGPSAEV